MANYFGIDPHVRVSPRSLGPPSVSDALTEVEKPHPCHARHRRRAERRSRRRWCGGADSWMKGSVVSQEEVILMPIAKAAVNAPLPPEWDEFEDDDGEVYFVSKITKKTSEHHPLDGYFFELINQKRFELADLQPPVYPMSDFHLLDASFGALAYSPRGARRATMPSLLLMHCYEWCRCRAQDGRHDGGVTRVRGAASHGDTLARWAPTLTKTVGSRSAVPVDGVCGDQDGTPVLVQLSRQPHHVPPSVRSHQGARRSSPSMNQIPPPRARTTTDAGTVDHGQR
jgi:hypothetical protein